MQKNLSYRFELILFRTVLKQFPTVGDFIKTRLFNKFGLQTVAYFTHEPIRTRKHSNLLALQVVFKKRNSLVHFEDDRRCSVASVQLSSDIPANVLTTKVDVWRFVNSSVVRPMPWSQVDMQRWKKSWSPKMFSLKDVWFWTTTVDLSRVIFI